MAKAIIICGPTATGKSSLGLQIAQKFPLEILSADSRQVYEYMDIGTGKDIPKGSKKIVSQLKLAGNQPVPFYLIRNSKIWGYDLSLPDHDFSIAEYYQASKQIICQIDDERKTPLIVGGSGFYIQSLVQPPATLFIKRDEELRREIENKNVIELQQLLRKVDKKQFNKMNSSDRKNSRRLVRAIEVATSTKNELNAPQSLVTDSLIIGIKQASAAIEHSVVKRVDERIEAGFSREVHWLMDKYPDWEYPAFSATGYMEWRRFLSGEISSINSS